MTLSLEALTLWWEGGGAVGWEGSTAVFVTVSILGDALPHEVYIRDLTHIRVNVSEASFK